DRVGRVKPVRIGLLLFVLGSLAAAMAPAIEVLIAARVLQALGGAAGAVASRAVVRDLYRGAAAARLNSRLVLVMGVAPIVAPMLGGALLELAGWRAIFAALAAAAAVALAVVWTWLPETAPPRGSAPRPTLRGLVGDRDFVRYALVLALSQAALFAYITGAPFVYIELEGATPSEFAWFFSANAAGYLAMSQINVRLRLRRAHRRRGVPGPGGDRRRRRVGGRRQPLLRAGQLRPGDAERHRAGARGPGQPGRGGGRLARHHRLLDGGGRLGGGRRAARR